MRPYSIPYVNILTNARRRSGRNAVAIFGFARLPVASTVRGAALFREQGFGNRIEMLDSLAARRQSFDNSPASTPPDSAAYADIDIMDSSFLKSRRAAECHRVVGIAPVDHYVAWIEQRRERIKHGVNSGGGHHQPDSPRFRQRAHKIGESRRPLRALLDQRAHRFRMTIVSDAFMASPHEPYRHIGAHATKTDMPSCILFVLEGSLFGLIAIRQSTGLASLYPCALII